MPDPHDEDAQLAILDMADDSVVADPIFPEFAELRSPQRLAEGAWIVGLGDPLVQERENSPPDLTVEPLEVAQRGAVEGDPPTHSGEPKAFMTSSNETEPDLPARLSISRCSAR